MSVLVDSDIVIEVLRARDPAICAQWAQLANSQSAVLVSPITVAEIGAGALPSESEIIARLFASLTSVDIDERVGRQAGLYLHQFAKSHGLTIADALIAASARLCSAALWTRNRKHFPMADLSFYA